MTDELISVVVPAFNAASTVAATVGALLRQTYPHMEVICVDDGSRDGTLRVLKELARADGRVRVFSQKNAGVTEARRYGCAQARGAYIGFADADDEPDPAMYATLYRNLRAHSADISHCGHEVVQLDGTREQFYNTGRLAVQNRAEGVCSLLAGEFEPGLWNKLFRKPLVRQLFDSGVMDASVKINEDLLMNYYLFKAANTSVLEDVCLYRYIKRENSASNAAVSSAYVWDQIRVKQIILADAAGASYETEARRALLITCITKYNLLLSVKGHAFEDDKQSIRQLIKAHQNDLKLLSKKHRAGARLLLAAPALYTRLYHVIS